MLAIAAVAFTSPAFAAACWQNNSGDRLTFSNATDGTLITRSGKKVDCASGTSPDGRDIACGNDPWSPSVRGLRNVLVWRGKTWYPNCAPTDLQMPPQKPFLKLGN